MKLQDTIHYSYEDIHNHTLRLIIKIQAQNYYGGHKHYDFIAALSRGGLVPGVIMSHEMGIPLRPVEWSTRDFVTRKPASSIVQDLHQGASVLLVDDINDSGKTFTEVIRDWKYTQDCPGTLTKATLFQRYTTTCPSDFYSLYIDHDSWIGFPWEKA